MISFGTTKFVPSSTLHRCCSSKVKALWDRAFKKVSCHEGFSQVYVKCCSSLYLLLLNIINAMKDLFSHNNDIAHIPKCG